MTDDEVRDAMRYAFATLKLVAEPGGSVALAALLSNKVPPSSSPIAVVISGANVDPGDFAAILSRDAAPLNGS